MTAFNIFPAPSDMERLNAKIEEKEKLIKKEAEDLKAMKALLRRK